MSGADQNAERDAERSAERGADRLSADTGIERGDGIASGVSTARTGVAAFVYERDVLRVTGADAVTFVQGQVSADVAALGVGDSAWSLLLEPQGKVDAWFRIARTGESELLIDVDRGWGEQTAKRLGRFLLRVDVTIVEVAVGCVALRGPLAAAGAAALAQGTATLRCVPVDWRGLSGVDVFGAVDGPAPEVPDAMDQLDQRVLHVLRVEQGWPAMGHELDSSTIPAEAGQWLIDESVNFTKGCYTGQELVARIDSRGGNVARHLRGLVLARSELHGAGQGLLEGGLLEQGAVALLDGVERATVTSAAYSPTLGAPIALAMVHRSVEPGATLEIDGVSATVVDLPFVSP